MRRKFSPEFKQQAVRRMAQVGASVGAREAGVRRKLLYEWRDALAGRTVSKGKPKTRPAAGEQRTTPDWKRMAEQLALENRFLASALQRIKERQPSSGGVSGKPSGKPSTPSGSRKAN